MNQGIPFARTIRALDADNFRASKLTWLLAVLVLCVWIWWAFTGRVPQYETLRNVEIEQNGETAIAYLDSAPSQIGKYAIVRTPHSSVTGALTGWRQINDSVQLTFHLARPVLLDSGPFSIEIQTGPVSPAAIALRTAGLKY